MRNLEPRAKEGARGRWWANWGWPDASPDGWYAAAKLGRSFTTESIALSKAGEVAREITEMVARQDPDYVRGLLPAEPRRRRLRTLVTVALVGAALSWAFTTWWPLTLLLLASWLCVRAIERQSL